jgi:hypothetical protein
MKKLIIITSIVFVLLSCSEFGGEGKTRYSVSITNNSEKEKTVSYTYNGISDTLAFSDTKNYEVKAYTEPPKNITDQNGIESIELKANGMTGNYTFSDLTPLDLNVINKLPIDVLIKAGNYIDDSGSPIFTISANAEKITAQIYTSKPNFTSLINYPVIIDWNFSDNTVYVTIR